MLNKLDIKYQPSKIVSLNEKGYRITLQYQQTIVAQKVTKRVHLIAPEHKENVTVVDCANPIVSVILFKR